MHLKVVLVVLINNFLVTDVKRSSSRCKFPSSFIKQVFVPTCKTSRNKTRHSYASCCLLPSKKLLYLPSSNLKFSIELSTFGFKHVTRYFIKLTSGLSLKLNSSLHSKKIRKNLLDGTPFKIRH